MKPLYPFFLLILWCWGAVGQNLVPNPSFEYSTGCPTSYGQIWRVEPWIKVGGGGLMTYYNECGPIQCGVPYNRVGVSTAHTGGSYADLALVYNNHALPASSEGNFLGTPLTDTLVEGKKYQVELYLSLWDSARFAAKNIGVYFSNEQPPSEGETLVTFIPQVRYEGDFLTDKVGWMRIAGEFIAEGGETFMTIGNFDGYHNSDTLNLHEGGIIAGGGVVNIGYWELAAYYIDDVSVVEDTTYHVGIDERDTPYLSIHPNPATDNVTIAHSGPQRLVDIHVFDVVGRTVHTETRLSENRMQLDLAHLPSGQYVISLFDGELRQTQKLMKQ